MSFQFKDSFYCNICSNQIEHAQIVKGVQVIQSTIGDVCMIQL